MPPTCAANLPLVRDALYLTPQPCITSWASCNEYTAQTIDDRTQTHLKQIWFTRFNFPPRVSNDPTEGRMCRVMVEKRRSRMLN
ncbi:hypothetical protein RB195_003416 [Necator americanus]|uniref:Uncharacterized protein n=1 Tax=Necator americanus TaxID=51031 RepID=A0ABR1DNG7_NECAM